MNDKNFIEELRQKREEYGVTQTRLAVACGISREYYNRIEKGKQPLNDELREIIEKQIERFNPQEPLFLLIDYFRVRFPTTDALAIIRDVLQLKSNYMLYEDYGKYGYESKYVLGDCALPGFVDSKNEEKTERNAGYLVVSHSGGGMLRQGTRKGIRRTPANRGMRAHWVVKGLDISEDVCHGMCP